ncbi:mechanosensitive ion channel protein MscS [Cupriavidus necator]|uniref:Small-conductance mechanosensitive channel n=1 Tax=Cupriavidus necator TaxID=106590 RepID=A0A1U9UZV0_CUPNE|nr:mechanosensitive ion channel family protein [Cupriavidus necator]AQV98212.1 mechanosensitive ion channel protein MscS [Cupriavidus necator]
MAYLLDPLFLGACVVLCDVLAWRLIPPAHTRQRHLARLAIFVLLTIVLVHGGMAPLNAAPFPGQPIRHFIAQALEIIWWLLAARVLTIMLGTLFLPQAWRGERLFQDVFGALIFVAAVVAAVAYVLELPVTGLLATSGALAIIVGLAVQSTLGDVFSGLVLNATQPYHPGDLVSVDGVDGKVLEINWRATHLLSAQGNLVVIPNSTTARARITNFSRPSELHGVNVTIEVTPEARPQRVLDALDRAIRGCRVALHKPEPSVLVKRMSANAVEYEMTCYVASMADKLAAANQLFDLAHRHLASAGIDLRPLTVAYNNVGRTDRRVRLLSMVSIFQALDEDELSQLAGRMSRHEYEAGQPVVASTDITDYLLLVDTGVLSVTGLQNGENKEIARLGPGDAFGESGVLAGIPMQVAIGTVTGAALYRLDKADLTPVLRARPDVGSEMCRLLSQHKESSDVLAQMRVMPDVKRMGLLQWLQDKMRALHQVGSKDQRQEKTS